MRTIERRIALMESRSVTKSDPAPCDLAFRRVRTALFEALMSSTHARCSVRPQAGKFGDSPSFKDLVQGLQARMSTGAVTPEDRHLLDSIPAEDLRQIGMTTDGVVALYAKLLGDF